MKSIITFIFLMLMVQTNLSAQNFWKKVNFPAGSGTIFTIISIGGSKYLAGSSNAVYISNDNGDNWSKLSEIAPTTIAAVFLKTKSGAILAGTSKGAYRSTDVGATWSPFNTGLDNPDIFSLLETPTGKIYAGSGKGFLYSSTDDGKTWTKVLTAGSYTYFESLAVNSKGEIFAGTYSSYGSEGVYKSTNDGAVWTKSSTGLVGATAWVLKIVSDDIIYAGSTKGVHKSTDNGNSWQQLITGMPSAYSTNCMAISNSGKIYIGTVLNGAYYSSDWGNTWNDLNSGLTNKMMQVILVTDNGYLIGGGSNSEVFKSNGIINDVEEKFNKLPDSYKLYQNYPNPFNPATIIKFNIPSAGNVKLVVYDLLGRIIKTLVNEYRNAGSYTVGFDSKDLPCGTYFYQISTGSFIDIKRLIILK